jgi:hypothetical protein
MHGRDLPLTMLALDFPRSMLIGGLLGGTFVATANFILYIWILPEVNSRLPEEDKITPFMVNFRLLEILHRHAEFVPHSKRRTAMYVVLGLGVFCMACSAY